MPRIQDIGAFNAVRESGLAKLMPAIPRITVGMGTCGRGNGAEEVYHASERGHRAQRPGCAAGRRGLLRLLLSGAAGQRAAAGQSAGGAAPRAGQRRSAHSRRRLHGEMPPDLIYCKIEEWDHITGTLRYGQGYPEIPLVERNSVLQGSEEDRAAQLRPHQSRRTSRNTSAWAATRPSTRS